MKNFILYLLVFALFGGSNAWAQTRIHSLPYTITVSDSYDIDTNLISTGSGIIVRVSNVTINLNGHAIIGSGTGIGLDIGSSSNVEVRNGTITNFNTGILNDEAPLGTRVIDMRVTNNVGVGIQLDIGGIIRESVISGNGGGIDALECVIQGNSVFNNVANGISAYTSTILDNNVTTNGKFGIHASHSTVKNNIVKGNGMGGIGLIQHCLVDGNTAVVNTDFDISECSTCAFGVNYEP